MPVLRPNIYKDLKYVVQDGNIVSTVNTRRMSNRVQGAQIFHTEEITSAEVNGVKYALPISTDIKSQYIRWGVNNGPFVGANGDVIGTAYFAKARVECLMATGSTMCQVDKPIIGEPTVDIALEGESYVISNGKRLYEYYPSADTLQDETWNMSSYIKYSVDTTKQDTLVKDYSGDSIPVNMWIKRVIPYPSVTTQDDVYATWAGATSIGAERDYWTEGSNFTATSYYSIDMLPPGVTPTEGQDKRFKCLQTQNVTLPIKKKVTKISPYTYQVDWSVPIRFNFIASSRVQASGFLESGFNELDSYAFSDVVKKVVINLTGQPLNQEYIDNSYSLDEYGELVEQNDHNKLFDITDAKELFTLDTTTHWTAKTVFDSEEQKSTIGSRINFDGTTSSVEGTNITDYIYVPAFYQIHIRNFVTGYAQGARYDKNFAFISALNVGSGDEFAASWDADCYVRFNYVAAEKVVAQWVYKLPWSEEIATRLLTKYKEGKYVCECTVQAKWAIENNIHIGTVVNILLPGAQYLSRNGKRCAFYIKNITKDFRAQTFEYVLRMQEV